MRAYKDAHRKSLLARAVKPQPNVGAVERRLTCSLPSRRCRFRSCAQARPLPTRRARRPERSVPHPRPWTCGSGYRRRLAGIRRWLQRDYLREMVQRIRLLRPAGGVGGRREADVDPGLAVDEFRRGRGPSEFTVRRLLRDSREGRREWYVDRSRVAGRGRPLVQNVLQAGKLEWCPAADPPPNRDLTTLPGRQRLEVSASHDPEKDHWMGQDRAKAIAAARQSSMPC